MSPNKKPARSRAATPKASPPAKKKLSLVAQVRQQGKLITELLQGRAAVLERVGALELANANRLEREKRELNEVMRILDGLPPLRVEGPTLAEQSASVTATLHNATRAATKDLLSTGIGAVKIGSDGSVKHVPSSELFKKLPWWRRAWLAICEIFVSPTDADR